MMLAVNDNTDITRTGTNLRVRLELGEWYEINKQSWRVDRRPRDGRVLFKDLYDEDFMTLSSEEIISLSKQGRFRKIPDPKAGLAESLRSDADVALDLISQSSRNAAFFRRDVVMAWLNRKTGTAMMEIVADVIEARKTRDEWIPRRGTSERSAFEWVRRWKKAGCPDGVDARLFIPQYHRSGNRADRYDPFVSRVLANAIEAALASDARPTVKMLYGKVAAEVFDERQRLINQNITPSVNLTPPSLKYVRSRFHNATPEELYRRRYGQRAAKEKFCPVGRCPDAYWPLQVVEIDHTQADVHLVDDHGYPAGRPYVTIAIDRYSRMVVGMHIGWEPPGWMVLATTLRQAVLYKDWLPHLYPSVTQEWACFGPPTKVVVDNAVEFHCASFKVACSLVPIDVDYAPIRMPEYKAKVERFIQTFKTSFMQALPGATSSDPRRNGAFSAERGARLTLEQFKELAFQWVLDVYHYQAHSGLDGRRPIDLWLQGMNERGGLPLPPPEENLLPLCGEVVTRTLSDKGIEFEGLLYNDGGAGHVRRIRNQLRGPSKHQVRVDFHDIRNLWLEDPEQRKWFQIPCLHEEDVTVTHPNGARVGLSLHQWREVTALARRQASAEGRPDFPDFARACRDLFDSITQVAKQPRARRQAQRLRKSGHPYVVPPSVGPLLPAPQPEADLPLEPDDLPPDVAELEAMNSMFAEHAKLKRR